MSRFLGEFRLTIDDKGRITLPAKYRHELDPGVVLTWGLDVCIRLYTQNEWDRIAAKVEELSSNLRDGRDYIRLMFGRANDLIPDKQGRIVVPAKLREQAGLDTEAVLVGANKYFEIWNPNAWDEDQLRLQENAPQIAERLSNLVI